MIPLLESVLITSPSGSNSGAKVMIACINKRIELSVLVTYIITSHHIVQCPIDIQDILESIGQGLEIAFIMAPLLFLGNERSFHMESQNASTFRAAWSSINVRNCLGVYFRWRSDQGWTEAGHSMAQDLLGHSSNHFVSRLYNMNVKSSIQAFYLITLTYLCLRCLC